MQPFLLYDPLRLGGDSGGRNDVSEIVEILDRSLNSAVIESLLIKLLDGLKLAVKVHIDLLDRTVDSREERAVAHIHNVPTKGLVKLKPAVKVNQTELFDFLRIIEFQRIPGMPIYVFQGGNRGELKRCNPFLK